MDPSKSYVTIDEKLLQPWLDAFLGACGLLSIALHRTTFCMVLSHTCVCCVCTTGVEATAENWTKVCAFIKLSSFDPKQHH